MVSSLEEGCSGQSRQLVQGPGWGVPGVFLKNRQETSMAKQSEGLLETRVGHTGSHRP